jgi:hypothetical protein
MKKVTFALFILTFTSVVFAQEIGDAEGMIYIVISFSSMFIPVVALIFIATRRGLAVGNKAIWGVVYLVFWYILQKMDILFVLFSPVGLAIYLQLLIYVLATAFFLLIMYKLTRPKLNEAEKIA